MKLFLLLLTTATGLLAVEHATYDSAGELTSVISHGAELPVHGGLFANFTGGLREPIQPHDQRTPISRDGLKLSWHGTTTFPNTSKIDFMADWAESNEELTLRTSAEQPGPFPIDLTTLDYVVDLPHDVFAGGTIGHAAKFPSSHPADPTFYRETVQQLKLATASPAWELTLDLDQARPVSIEDHWDRNGHVFRLHIALHEGALPAKANVAFHYTLRATAQPHAANANLRVDPQAPRYTFDGFGGDYCFNLDTPVVEYTMENLHPAWARLEFKAFNWYVHQDHPDAALKRDFEMMQRVQHAGIPWVLSVWRLPEHFYTDPNQKPFSTFARTIAPDRWPEFLDLLTSYLAYLKKNYGAEPNYFSFNEPDLGVNVGFTGETHRDMIKRIGARLAADGFKTKMLLGDTANPRDTHLYVLPTAADAEAMKYVGAVSLHSWGNGTPEQFRSWGDVGAWIGLPLIVAEAGTDPGAYRNDTFDSYSYGLKEMRQYHELLRDVRPTAIIYWEYTEDYGLVHRKPDGTIEPTGRFWMMKHFADLTPRKSEVVTTSSDQDDVSITAFVKNGAATVHVLNQGPERDATIVGLPAGSWKIVTTTEESGFQSRDLATPPTQLHLPARSFVSLVKQ